MVSPLPSGVRRGIAEAVARCAAGPSLSMSLGLCKGVLSLEGQKKWFSTIFYASPKTAWCNHTTRFRAISFARIPIFVRFGESLVAFEHFVLWKLVESLSVGSFGSLDVLIEKDFPCLDRCDEDNEDTLQIPTLVRRVSRFRGNRNHSIPDAFSVDLLTSVSVDRQLLMAQFMTAHIHKGLI
jgi:hypothetical protein